MTKRIESLIILIPVFNDYESFAILWGKLKDLHLEASFKNVHVIVVDDCSTERPPDFTDHFLRFSVLNLAQNLGHQKAIAIGLAYIADQEKADLVLVMDGDGEDRVEDIPQLLSANTEHPHHIVFAKRRKRKESLLFKVCYAFYKLAFYILTGRILRFGNYSLIPSCHLNKVVHLSDIWNHFSGGITRSKIPYTSVLLDRGQRYKGQSKMNFVSLIIHGLSAVAVYIDVVIVRIFLFSLVAVSLSLLAMMTIILIRIFTDVMIPGWASSALLGIFMILMISCFMVFNLLLVILSYRTQKQFIPAIHYSDYIDKQ